MPGAIAILVPGLAPASRRRSAASSATESFEIAAWPGLPDRQQSEGQDEEMAEFPAVLQASRVVTPEGDLPRVRGRRDNIDHVKSEFPRQFAGRVPYIIREVSCRVKADDVCAWGSSQAET